MEAEQQRRPILRSLADSFIFPFIGIMKSVAVSSMCLLFAALASIGIFTIIYSIDGWDVFDSAALKEEKRLLRIIAELGTPSDTSDDAKKILQAKKRLAVINIMRGMSNDSVYLLIRAFALSIATNSIISLIVSQHLLSLATVASCNKSQQSQQSQQSSRSSENNGIKFNLSRSISTILLCTSFAMSVFAAYLLYYIWRLKYKIRITTPTRNVEEYDVSGRDVPVLNICFGAVLFILVLYGTISILHLIIRLKIANAKNCVVSSVMPLGQSVSGSEQQ